LRVQNVEAGYGTESVIFDVSLELGRGEILGVLGHNGAGKTTLLKTIFGLLQPSHGSVTIAGEYPWGRPRESRQRGVVFIPSEEFVFSTMTVKENLALGTVVVHASRESRAGVDEVLALFPILKEREKQLAGTLSGGQQRMLILAMSLMAHPQLLLLDEPSLGLAPVLVGDIFSRLRSLSEEEGISVILVEQNVDAVLRIADRICIMRSGRIVRTLPSEVMRAMDRTEWWTLF
jgi:branched-chain amino acid transport system ATP-binding protein